MGQPPVTELSTQRDEGAVPRGGGLTVKDGLALFGFSAAVATGWIFALVAIDNVSPLGAGTAAGIVTVALLLQVTYGVALGVASGRTSSQTEVWEARLGLGASVAATLFVAWALAYAKKFSDFPKGIYAGTFAVFGALIVGLSIAIAWSVLSTGSRPRRTRKSYGTGIFSFGPTFAFWLGVSYILLLVGLALIYRFVDPIHRNLGGSDAVLGNVLPIAVPWFGALGAVTISIYGVFRHNDEWQTKFNFWHVARPLVGAVLGTIAFFIFVGLINAASPEEVRIDAKQQGTLIVYYLLAFVVGYREETFRDLIKRATDLLFKPGGLPDEKTVEILPSTVDYAPGENKELQIRNLTGVAIIIPADAVTFPGAPTEESWQVAEPPKVPGGRDWWKKGTASPLAPGGSLWITTVWTPSTEGPTETATLQLTYSGFEGPPKTAQLIGIVPSNPNSDETKTKNDDQPEPPAPTPGDGTKANPPAEESKTSSLQRRSRR